MRLSFFLLFVMLTVLARSQVVVSDPDKIVNLGYTAEFIEDTHGDLAINDWVIGGVIFLFEMERWNGQMTTWTNRPPNHSIAYHPISNALSPRV